MKIEKHRYQPKNSHRSNSNWRVCIYIWI